LEDLVSIIIPVHNVEKYIGRCLESVINQTYQNIEIILIVDSSTDKSEDICLQYKNKYNRIILQKSENKSAGKSRNLGIDLVKGKYVCFVDSDDYIDKNYIYNFCSKIKETNADAVFCGYNKIKDDELIVYSKYNEKLYNKEEINEKIICNSFRYKSNLNDISIVAVWGAMYRAEIIFNKNIRFLDENEYLSEDSIFNCQFLKQCKKVSVINKNMYYYNSTNENSITTTKYDKRLNKINVWYKTCKKEISGNKIAETALDKSYLMYLVDSIKQEVFISKNRKEFKGNFQNIIEEESEVNILKKKNILDGISKKDSIILVLAKYHMYNVIYMLYKVHYVLKNSIKIKKCEGTI